MSKEGWHAEANTGIRDPFLISFFYLEYGSNTNFIYAWKEYMTICFGNKGTQAHPSYSSLDSVQLVFIYSSVVAHNYQLKNAA